MIVEMTVPRKFHQMGAGKKDTLTSKLMKIDREENGVKMERKR